METQNSLKSSHHEEIPINGTNLQSVSNHEVMEELHEARRSDKTNLSLQDKKPATRNLFKKQNPQNAKQLRASLQRANGKLAESVFKVMNFQEENRRLKEELLQMKGALRAQQDQVSMLNLKVKSLTREKAVMKIENSLKATFNKLVDTLTATGHFTREMSSGLVMSSVKEAFAHLTVKPGGVSRHTQQNPGVIPVPVQNQNLQNLKPAPEPVYQAEPQAEYPSNFVTTHYSHSSASPRSYISNGGPTHNNSLNMMTEPTFSDTQQHGACPQPQFYPHGMPFQRDDFPCPACPHSFRFVEHLKAHLRHAHRVYLEPQRQF